jgi:hypothetical protein
VINPFSIKWFLEKKKLDNYWYNSGTPIFAYLLSSKTDNYLTIFDKELSITDPIEVMDINILQDESFLFQAGYFTIDKIDTNGLSPIHLKIPNLEVLGAISKDIAHKCLVPPNTSNPVKYLTNSQSSVLSAFQSRNVVEAEKQLSCIFAGINKQLYHGEGKIFFILCFYAF